MFNRFPIFRRWVPEWLVRIILFSLLLPSTVIFFLPLANINAAAGYYGSEPADIQFAVVLFYAGYVGFYALERRFFVYLATKEYFILFTFLNILTTFICYHVNDTRVLFPLRFFQGMLFSSTVNLSLSVMFTRLKSERAREISFSVFFGLLICAMPFNNLVTADLIDSFDFNAVYKIALFSYVPGLFMLIIAMNNVRLNTRFPLYKLDWQSFSIYSIFLCLVGYIMVYGQEYYWMEDNRIRYCVLGITLLGVVYFARQRSMKRPYIDLSVFRFRNYNVGILLLFIMYLCRFASGVTNAFFASVLKFDPIHVSYMNAWNLAGLITGVVVSCSLVLQKKNIRFIWIPGFAVLLIFHAVMFFLFNTQANENTYFAPLFLQGLGVGMLMVPTIVFAVSSVPIILGPAASAVCLAVRYFGFCISIAVMNFFELFGKSRHYNAFQDHLTLTDPVVRETLRKQMHHLASNGLLSSQSAKASEKLLVKAVNAQSQLRFGMDYYEMMSWLLVGTLLFVCLFPYLNKTVVFLRSRILAPA